MIQGNHLLDSTYRANIGAAQRCASLLLEQTECLLRLQLDVARSLFGHTAAQLRDACAKAGQSQTPGNWGTLFGANLEWSAEAMHHYMEATARARSELTRLGREQMNLAESNWKNAIEGLAGAAGGYSGTESADRRHRKAA